MPVNGPEVVRATPAARERVVDTVVAAFRNDPVFKFFFPDSASYDAEAAAFAANLFDRRVAHGTVWIVEGGAAVSMWDPPAGAGGDARKPELSPRTLARLDAYNAAVHAALPATAHWYLGVLATHPEHTGRRWGHAVMAAGLQHAATAGLPAYLETTNPANLAMYRRAGWEVVASLTVQTVAVWIMKHPGSRATHR
jgi:ribosomal protein S18 acetylase RimI-like enzyme